MKIPIRTDSQKDTAAGRVGHQQTKDMVNLIKMGSRNTNAIAAEKWDTGPLSALKQAAANTTTSGGKAGASTTSQSSNESSWGSGKDSVAYLNHTMAHQCVQNLEGKKSQKWWVLLDNQSTVDVFVNKGLLKT